MHDEAWISPEPGRQCAGHHGIVRCEDIDLAREEDGQMPQHFDQQVARRSLGVHAHIATPKYFFVQRRHVLAYAEGIERQGPDVCGQEQIHNHVRSSISMCLDLKILLQQPM